MCKTNKINYKQNKQKKILDNIISILIAIMVAILFRSLFFQAFVIPSGSMEPNLLIGDYLFVSKYNYGYSRYSFPFGLFGLGGESRVIYKEPERGDVVVFKSPANTKEDYVKRVIGLPGDKIQIIGGVLYINNKAVKYKKLETINQDGVKLTVLEETLPNNKTYKIYKDYSIFNPANNTDTFYIKKEHFFVMGDNRDHSLDSRFLEIGQIPKVNLVGKARLIFFSIEDGSFLQFWKWYKIRFDRIFTTIY